MKFNIYAVNIHDSYCLSQPVIHYGYCSLGINFSTDFVVPV